MKKLLSMLIVITLLVQVFSVTSNNVYASSEIVNGFTEMKDSLRPHLISKDAFIEFNYTGTMDNFESNVSTMINELASEPNIYGLIAGVSYGYGGSVGNMTVQFNFTYNEIQTPNESASTIEEMKTVLRPHLIAKDVEVELLYTGSTATLGDDIGVMINELANESEITGTLTGYSIGQSGVEGNLTLTFTFTYAEANTEEPDSNIDSATSMLEIKNLVRVAMTNDLVSYEVLYTGDTSNLGDDISTLVNELANESELQGKLSSYGYGTNGTAGDLTINFSFEYNVDNNEGAATMTEVKDLLRPALISKQEEIVVLYTGDTSNISNDISTMVNELASESEITGLITGYSFGQDGSEGNLTLTFNFTYASASEPDPVVEGVATMLEVKDLLRPALISKDGSIEFAYIGSVATLQAELNNVLNELLTEEELVNTVNQFGTSLSGTEGNLTVTLSVVYQGIDGSISLYSDEESFVNGLYDELLSHPNEVRIGYHTESFDSETIGTLLSQATAKDDYLKQSLTSYSISYMRYGYDYEITITPTFLTTELEEADLESRIGLIFESILNNNMDLHYKIKAIYDYISEEIAYDNEFVSTTAYSAIINKKTTCSGYAMLTQKMFSMAGIDSRIISGGNHAWNIVEIDGNWYHLDTTGGASVYNSGNDYSFYLLCDNEIVNTYDFNTENYPLSDVNYLESIKNNEIYESIYYQIINAKKNLGIDLNADNITIPLNGVKTIGYSLLTLATDNIEIEWSSSDTSVISVDNGLLQPINLGDAVIIIQSEDGKYTDTCNVRVVEAINYQQEETFSLVGDNISLNVGDEFLINYSTSMENEILWSSNNPYIAPVKNGRVYALSEGEATITAFMNGIEDTFVINIIDNTNQTWYNEYQLPEMLFEEVNSINSDLDFSMNIKGEAGIDESISVIDGYDELNGLYGFIGDSIDITTTSNFEWADLSVRISDELLELFELNELAIYWYNEINDQMVELDTSYDFENNTLTSRLTHFSKYWVGNKTVVDAYGNARSNKLKNIINSKRIDLSIIIDNKWSYDLNNIKSNIKDIVVNLDNTYDLNIYFYEIQDYYEKYGYSAINNPAGFITKGDYINKDYFKFVSDFNDSIEDKDEIINSYNQYDEINDFLDDLSNLQEYEYSINDGQSFTSEYVSEVYTEAYSAALNNPDLREFSRHIVILSSELEGFTYFTENTNSVLDKRNSTSIVIQRTGNQIFDEYISLEDDVTIYENFSEPIIDFIRDRSLPTVEFISYVDRLLDNNGTVDGINRGAWYTSQRVNEDYVFYQDLGVIEIDEVEKALIESVDITDWKPTTSWARLLGDAGFIYDTDEDVNYTRMYALQRYGGYCDLYDSLAGGMLCNIHCEPIIFTDKYDNEWMIELWKGQYGFRTGAEVGIYRRYDSTYFMDNLSGGFTYDNFFECVKDKDLLGISFDLYRTNIFGSDRELLFSRDMRDHWWQTGFNWGVLSKRNQLDMDITIDFNNKPYLIKPFCDSLVAMGYATPEQNGNQVTFVFDEPHSQQPLFADALENYEWWFNGGLVASYKLVKLYYGAESNDPNNFNSPADNAPDYIERAYKDVTNFINAMDF